MERLTFQINKKWCVRIGSQIHTGQAVDRLAAFEDIGLEPTALKELILNNPAIKIELPSPSEPTEAPETKTNNILDERWEIMSPYLPARSYNCIARISLRHGIKTVGELAAMKEDDIWSARGLGKVSRKEISDVLMAFGITESEWYRSN